jgi:hypothetical protein
MAKNAGDVRGHKGDSKAENSGEFKGHMYIPYSRASMKTDSSESIGAGDVGNFYHSSDDASPSNDLTMPCPEKKK